MHYNTEFTKQVCLLKFVKFTPAILPEMHEVMVREGISGQGPGFRSLAAVSAHNGTASESSKVGYACALTINRKHC